MLKLLQVQRKGEGLGFGVQGFGLRGVGARSDGVRVWYLLRMGARVLRQLYGTDTAVLTQQDATTRSRKSYERKSFHRTRTQSRYKRPPSEIKSLSGQLVPHLDGTGSTPLWCYAFAVRCPVLAYAMLSSCAFATGSAVMASGMVLWHARLLSPHPLQSQHSPFHSPGGFSVFMDWRVQGSLSRVQGPRGLQSFQLLVFEDIQG
eukprot:1328115-Rhodomonas_salina.1